MRDNLIENGLGVMQKIKGFRRAPNALRPFNSNYSRGVWWAAPEKVSDDTANNFIDETFLGHACIRLNNVVKTTEVILIPKIHNYY